MGTSTDAIICYGITLEGEDELPEWMEDHDDFDDFLYSKSGLPQYGEDGHDFSARREWLEKQPCEMVLHCSYDYPMYILAIRGMTTTASRGYPEIIEPKNIPTEKLEAFNAFASQYGYDEEPRMVLCSMWG